MRILGCDVSAWQANINFQKMEDAGAKFVFLRKQLGYYGDLRFFENLEKAKQTNLKIGAYGVPFPGYDIETQFDKFIEGISPSDLDFPPVADVERRNNLSKSQNIGDVLDYTFNLKNWWGDAIFYTAKYVWEDYYSSAVGWIDDWDLWVANYNNSDQPTYIPRGWEYRKGGTPVPVKDSYAIWQFSADGNNRGAEFGGQSEDMDLNLMHDWFWEKYITPPTPPDEGILKLEEALNAINHAGTLLTEYLETIDNR